MSKEPYLILSDGQSAHTLKWAKELIKYYDIYVMSLNGFSDELKALLGDNKAIEYHVSVKVSGGNIGVLKSVGFVKKLIHTIRPIIINAHYITSYGTVACLAAMFAGYKGKVVLSAWGTDILVTPWKNKLYYYMTRFVLNRAHLVTSDAEYMSDKIREIAYNADVMTFPFGVEKLPDMEYTDKDDKLFFSNRALEPNYNIDSIIKMFYNLYKLDNDLKLVIAHNGTQKEYLMGLVESFGLSKNVDFVGYLSAQEMADYYRRSRYFISIPTSDATSVSLLEAMACGCVPIVSDLPANKEWIIDGENGIIYKTGTLNLDVVDPRVVYDKNREIIEDRAIWSDSVVKFKNKLENL